MRIGAEGGTRTPTGCPIRPSNVRVYQFHHFGLFRRFDYLICLSNAQKEELVFCAGAVFAASFEASGFAVVLAPFSAGLSADGVAAGEVPVGAAPGCEAGVSAGVTGATGACSAGP